MCNAVVGFYGKIPSRGDFVRAGLPRAFTDPWSDWMERMLAASHSCLEDAWVPAWLEAPAWRFALTPGICGPDAVIGVWLPSIDRVGRYYPLTLAGIIAAPDTARLIRQLGGFLAEVECAGRDAIKNDLPPQEFALRIESAADARPADPGIDPSLCPTAGGLWWTEGAPRVPPGVFATAGLPDSKSFSAMLSS
jgi:type VI secretion system protein ImpM